MSIKTFLKPNKSNIWLTVVLVIFVPSFLSLLGLSSYFVSERTASRIIAPAIKTIYIFIFFPLKIISRIPNFPNSYSRCPSVCFPNLFGLVILLIFWALVFYLFSCFVLLIIDKYINLKFSERGANNNSKASKKKIKVKNRGKNKNKKKSKLKRKS